MHTPMLEPLSKDLYVMSLASLASERISNLQPSLIRAVFDKKRPTSLNLGLGQPSENLPSHLLDEGWRRFRSADMGYTPNAGLPALRELIASYYRHPHALSSQNVIITCGSQEALACVMAACLDFGDHVLVPDPGFPGYRMTADLMGATTIAVPRSSDQGFRLDASAIERALTPRTRLVILNSPSNPTGAIDTIEELQKLATLAEAHNFWILSDEIYSEIRFSQNEFPSITKLSSRAILVSGLSKSVAMTGFRLGYVVAPSPISEHILRAHATATTCAPTFSQHMAQVIFEKPEHLRMHQRLYTERRKGALESMERHLPTVPYLSPEGAFYLMLNLSQHTQDSLQFCLDLLETKDVIATPGRAFGHLTEGWIRTSFAGSPETFNQGIRRMGEFITSLTH
jgi:aspartate/methionine/tyrosine aminotransferase